MENISRNSTLSPLLRALIISYRVISIKRTISLRRKFGYESASSFIKFDFANDNFFFIIYPYSFFYHLVGLKAMKMEDFFLRQQFQILKQLLYSATLPKV